MTMKNYCPLVLVLLLAQSATLWADTSNPESKLDSVNAETLTSQTTLEGMATDTKLADNVEPDLPQSWSALWE